MPTKGFRKIDISDLEKIELRERYLHGESVKSIRAWFKGSTSNFWKLLNGMAIERRRNKQQINDASFSTLQDRDLGWIAGIIDGEGWIGIARLRPKYYQPRVDVKSTTLVMQERLHSLLGGHLSTFTARKNCRPLFGWSVWSIWKVRAVLTLIKPYLVVKQEMAATVLRFCERHANELRSIKPSSEDQKDYEMIRSLNRKGVK